MNNESGRTRDGLEIINKCGVENCACKLQDGGDHSSSTTNPQFITDMWQVLDSAGNLLLSKHEKYGPKNISGAPGGPENGLRVRMWDKMARLNNLIENPDVDPGDESLNDTLIDLLNYCAIFIMVRDGKWPSE